MLEWGQKAKAALSNLACAPPQSHVLTVFYILSVLGPPGISMKVSTFLPKKKKKSLNLCADCARPRTQMAESKPDPIAQSLSDNEVKAPNLFERVKEEIEAILHSEKSPHHHKETHGKRNDIDENTPLDDVRAPNVFDRAKEEFEALVEAIHPRKESPTHERRDETTKTQSKQGEADSLSENNVKKPNFSDRTKKKIEATTHNHHKETHGTSDDIDEKTPIYDVKAPNVFERAKEEIEAVIETVHPKKEERNSVSSPRKEGGFMLSIGRTLEKVCSPRGSVRD